MRSASSIVVSRNLSCFSSRARFFLYLAKGLPFASTHGDVRSKSCMIAETANLTAGLKDVKEATVATNTRRESSKNGKKPRISFMFGWEQIANLGCLNRRR